MNPRLPTELKKFRGTLNTTREKKNPSADKAIAKLPGVIIPKDERLSTPKTLKSSYVRKYWKSLTNNLIQMQVLSYADIPQLENMMIILEKLRSTQEEFANCKLSNEIEIVKFDMILKLVNKLTTMFNDLASKYYVSPAARSKLTLDMLNIQKTEQEITKNKSAIDELIAKRKTF